MIDHKLAFGLKLFIPIAIIAMLLLSPAAAYIDSRPISSSIALLLAVAIGLTIVAVVVGIAKRRSPLTWRQERELAQRTLDAARKGQHLQEYIRLRDEINGEQKDA